MKAFFPRKIDHGSKPPSCSKPGHGSELIRTHSIRVAVFSFAYLKLWSVVLIWCVWLHYVGIGRRLSLECCEWRHSKLTLGHLLIALYHCEMRPQLVLTQHNHAECREPVVPVFVFCLECVHTKITTNTSTHINTHPRLSQLCFTWFASLQRSCVCIC